MNLQENMILNRLKKARIDKGLSGDEVARKIGKSDNSFISRLENGKSKLNIDTLNKLCEVYELNPMELFADSHKASNLSKIRREGFLSNLEYRSESNVISEKTKDQIKTILPTLRRIGKVMKRLGESSINLRDIDYSLELPSPSSLESAKQLGKKVATSVREYLKLGNDPIADIQNLVWFQLRVSVCRLELDDDCHGIYNRDAAGNPLIIYSSKSPKQRNIFTIAHELGHHFFSQGESFIDKDLDSDTPNIKEALADAFAQELLVPQASLNEYMKVEGLYSIDLQQKHIVQLCQYFKVSYLMLLFVLRGNSLINENKFVELRSYKTKELVEIGYTPDKYYAEDIKLQSQLENLVARGIRRDKLSKLYVSEILNITEQEVEAII